MILLLSFCLIFRGCFFCNTVIGDDCIYESRLPSFFSHEIRRTSFYCLKKRAILAVVVLFIDILWWTGNPLWNIISRENGCWYRNEDKNFNCDETFNTCCFHFWFMFKLRILNIIVVKCKSDRVRTRTVFIREQRENFNTNNTSWNIFIKRVFRVSFEWYSF